MEAAGSAGQQGWHQRPKLLGAQPIPTSLAQTIPSIVLEFKLLPSLNRGSFRTKVLGGTPSTKYISPRRSSGPAFVTNLASEVTVHYVHFVKYDNAVSFYDAVSDTKRRRGGNRGIFTEEGVDTVAYFGGNRGSRV